MSGLGKRRNDLLFSAFLSSSANLRLSIFSGSLGLQQLRMTPTSTPWMSMLWGG
jgi:hypothetical protein